MNSNDAADTAPPEQVPFADAPCDVCGCMRPWTKRVEYTNVQPYRVWFVCDQHNQPEAE